MRSSLTRLARRTDGPGAPAAPRTRAGVLVLPFSGPGPGARSHWVLLTVLAAVALCCLAAALSRDTTFLAVTGADPGPQVPDPEWLQLCDATEQRSAEKFALASQVIEGRLPLRQAAARFRDLNARPPAFNWEAFRQTYPGDSDDERHCREVIQFVGQELLRRPGADPAAAGRLEAELRGLLEHGDCHLPGSDHVRPGG